MTATDTPRPRRRRLRAVLSWLHLWLGLAIGGVFALVALAGTVLVFHVELLRVQHPELTGHAPVADGQVLAHIIDQWGPKGLRTLGLPREALPVWQGYFEDGRRGYFSPADGSLLLNRGHHDDWLLWLHEFHVELLGGPAGKKVLGVVGWIALGLLISGLYLWWPKRGRWLAHLKMYANPPVRRWLSWHRGGGVVLLPLVVLITLTGVGMIYSKGFHAVLTTLFGGATHQPPAATATATAEAPDWSRVLSNAQTALPGARVRLLSVPGADDYIVSFRARAAGEWHPNGRSMIRLDRAGTPLQVIDATDDPLGTRMHQAIYPLHIGSVGGGPLRWATALAGLLPAFLLISGFLFWRRRRGN